MSEKKAVEFTRTKIIATIGPASRNYETIGAMVEEGMDVARMNFSHSTHEDHQQTVDLVRKYNLENKTNVCLLGDLQGPKLRIGMVLNNEIFLSVGKKIMLTSEETVSTPEKLYIKYDRLAQDIKPGEYILLDDGKLTIEIISSDHKNLAEGKVIHGGRLTSKKGVNFPHSQLSVPAISDKDIADLEFALKNEVEWIALSFVRNADDITQLRALLHQRNSKAKVIAKIEKPEAVKNIEDIIAASDAIMVARGDLGVEMEMEQVPILQKQIVKSSINAAKPVIIATQMMESMIQNATPTRAETNDVTNAVLDGADAVMLSAETSTGLYPVEVVKTMERIVRYAETQDAVYNKRKVVNPSSHTFLSDEICHQACLICDQLNAKAIVSMTHSGYTAFQLASFRPKAPIFIFTDNKKLFNAFSLVWGVQVLFYNRFATTDETIKDVNGVLKSLGHVSSGNLVINTASMPLHERSRTNTIKVSRIE
ncbi:MAG: pyruvate kinase [Chitinophagales bacterium]|nr:pyruvate kinase [Chitinophagales bacterium]